jgi:L-threonylcarbamoyladenylate synthase
MSGTQTEIWPADADAITRAAALLRAGELVAFPTETVYGLGADATNDNAVAAIFAAKDRPRFNPLIVHVASTDDAARLIDLGETGAALAAAFWPGALTLVGKRRPACGLSLLVSAGLDTAAVRVPSHAIAHDLIAAAGVPVAAPSANPSGTLSPTAAEHVARALAGRVAVVLDGGPSAIGLESTVVDVSGARPTILRPGGIAAEDIEAVTGRLAVAGAEIKSPGMLERHYAPSRPLRLNASAAEPGETLLAFGPNVPEDAPADALNLSPDGDLVEAAANLFSMLHALDRAGTGPIAVMPIPETGLGAAINDRLRRAAAR